LARVSCPASPTCMLVFLTSTNIILIHKHSGVAGFFGKGKKQKPLPPSTATAAAQSRDSLNTVFTSSSDGPEAMRRQGKRLSVHTTTSTHNILRKRHSKATTSSSGERILSISHQISLYLTISHYISSYLTISHFISQYLTKSHYISPNIIISHQISQYLPISHYISPYILQHLTISPNFSLYLTIYRNILPYLNSITISIQLHHISATHSNDNYFTYQQTLSF